MFISVKQPEVVFKNYYESVILLQEYVQSNISELTEQFTNDGDLVFLGKWHNGSGAKATAFRLSDGRGQGGWLLHVELI